MVPPVIVNAKVIQQITINVLNEENATLILLIDSRNSFWLIIPFRWTGYVKSNSAVKHPPKIF